MLRKVMLSALVIVAGTAGAGADTPPTAADWARDPVVRAYVDPSDYAWDFNAPAGSPNAAPGFAPTLGGPLPAMTALVMALGQAR